MVLTHLLAKLKAFHADNLTKEILYDKDSVDYLEEKESLFELERLGYISINQKVNGFIKVDLIDPRGSRGTRFPNSGTRGQVSRPTRP